jgi:hypothetical protein
MHALSNAMFHERHPRRCAPCLGVRGLWFLRVLAVLAVLLGSASAIEAQTVITLAWDANTEPDVAGYEVSYGIQSGVYSTVVDVGNVISRPITLTSGIAYYFAVKAYNSATPRQYSPYSAEVMFDPVGGTAPAITTQPSDQGVNAGATAVFTAAASGSPTPTVRWQVSAPGGGTWADIGGATSPTYSVTAALADSGRQYRAVFTNSVGSTTTGAATLTVQAPGVVGDLNGDGTPELLWRSQVTGANAAWDLAGVTHVGTTWLGTEPDLGWALVGTGDINGDGQADLIWRHLATGTNAVWYLDGLTRTATAPFDAELDLDSMVMGSPTWCGGTA